MAKRRDRDRGDVLTHCNQITNAEPMTIAGSQQWPLPAEYDWSISTFDNYQGGEQNEGAFATTRDRHCDDYHGCYTSRRQKMQDSLITRVVGHGERMPRPWVIFSAGPFLSGKSHVLSWLLEQQHIPLPNLVQTDLDAIRTSLPEWHTYLQRQPHSAVGHTQRESGTCAMVAQWEAFSQGRHVWIDGSLQNAVRQEQFFNEIKESYPQYRIAIVSVRATWDTIKERSVSSPVREGGRLTSSDHLEQSFQVVAKSVLQLAPLADLVVHVSNDGSAEPQLVEVSEPQVEGLVGQGLEIKSWDRLRSYFSQCDDEEGMTPK